jgi:hypothetical protein
MSTISILQGREVKAPIFLDLLKSFYLKFLPAVASVLDILHCVTECSCSGAAHRCHSSKLLIVYVLHRTLVLFWPHSSPKFNGTLCFFLLIFLCSDNNNERFPGMLNTFIVFESSVNIVQPWCYFFSLLERNLSKLGCVFYLREGN